MLFQQLNRSDTDKVYVSVYNVEGATITTGLPVSLANTSINGVNAVVANGANDYRGFIGVAKSNIANNDYGLVQITGWVDSVLLSAEGTSITINALDPLVPAPAGFTSADPTYVASGLRFLIASNVPVAVSAAGYASGLLRML
jgi:hypothetical protein